MNDIINMEKFKQGIIFGDIEYDNMRPSDIDLVMEVRDKCWVIAEIKRKGAEVKTGQRLMLERLAKDLRSTGKPVLCVIAEHNHRDNEDIDASNCIVTKSWNGNSWQKFQDSVTLSSLIRAFLEKKYKKV